MIEPRDFRAAYREAVAAVTDDDLCFRLPASSDRLGVRGYLHACETLYLQALQAGGRWGEGRQAGVWDAGGSFGAFAAALRLVGVPVVEGSVAEEPVDLAVGLSLHGKTASASEIALRSRELLRPGGRLVLVVPSSSYWPRRMAELRRRAARPPEDGLVELGTPAYDSQDVRDLLRSHGLQLGSVRARDYTPAGLGGPLRQLVAGVAKRVAPQHREVWVALATQGGVR